VRVGSLPKWEAAAYASQVEATRDHVTVTNDFTDPAHLSLTPDDFRDALHQWRGLIARRPG
jgi:hypothetical protein